ncbi:MAG TPA: hypothetical protein VN038_01485 [Dyadobacter sp.]|nr:hypothetical protein [Dyadobacter sp.]
MFEKIHSLYLDYVNNFLTAARFAEYYQITEEKAQKLITTGRKLHARYNPEPLEQFVDVAHLVVSSPTGIHAAQVFVQAIGFENFDNMTRESFDILSAGYEHEEYVETWGEMDALRVRVTRYGRTWRLGHIPNMQEYHDYMLVYEHEGDIYLYPVWVKIDWEAIETC